MLKTHRALTLILIAAAVVAALAVTALYAIAVGSLAASGPNVHGYALLAVANHCVPWLAALVVIAVCAMFSRRSVAAAAVSLAVASAIVLALSSGARSLALFLSQVNQHAQAPEANSIILAVAGSARDVSPAWVVLAFGVLALVGIRGVSAVLQKRAGATV